MFPAVGALGGTEVTLLVSNDFATLTPQVDDLYTSSLGAAVSTGRLRVTLDENMFTDREAGLRFDETWLTVSVTLPPAGGWRSRAEAGAVRVGEGIFGQDFQNLVHRVLWFEELSLDYIDETRGHALLRVEAERPFAATAALEIGPWIDLSAAFGFKRHAILGGTLRWNGGGALAFFGRAAARYSDTELALLDPWVDGWAPLLEGGFDYKEFLSVSYSINAFGTEDHHFHLRFRWTID